MLFNKDLWSDSMDDYVRELMIAFPITMRKYVTFDRGLCFYLSEKVLDL